MSADQSPSQASDLISGEQLPGFAPGLPDFDPTTVPIREAATVMLLRDTAAGPEVFMLRRTHAAVFGPGFYVFPGGRLDPSDRAAEIAGRCDGPDDAWASARLGVPDGGLGFWVAAIRECFEEAGVLLARRPDGTVIDFDEHDEATTDRFNALRHAIHDGTTTLAAVCAAEDLRLITGDLAYFAHWITPPGGPRRFSTRFLVARAPAGQHPLHDNSETIDSLWIRPAAALAHFAAREWEMMPPTVGALEFLAAHADVDAAMAATHALRSEPPLPPRRFYGDEGFVTEVYPGDPRYAGLSDVFTP